LLFASILDGADRVEHALAAGRGAYVHVARGSLDVGGQRLQAGDALKVTGESSIAFANADDAEVLLFDLPL
jgi:redox-sensitive bicupin YhaK (pirin superfamily)